MITIARLILDSTLAQEISVPDNTIFLGVVDQGGLPVLDVTVDDTQVLNARMVYARYVGFVDPAGQIDFDLSTHTYLGNLGDIHFWVTNV